MRRPWIVIAGLALFLVVGLTKMLPFLTADRTLVASTPTVRPFVAEARVDVPGRGRVCIDSITFEPAAQAAQVQLRTDGRQADELLLSASAPGGYTASGRLARGAPDGAVVTIPFPAASREMPDGVLCLRNTGRHRIALVAAGEPRSQSASTTTVNGKPAPVDASLTLVRAQQGSLLSHASDVLSHAAAWRPFPIGTATLWLLAALLIIGVPAAVLWMVQWAADADRGR